MFDQTQNVIHYVETMRETRLYELIDKQLN